MLVKGSEHEDLLVQALKECQAAVDAGKPLESESILAKYPTIREELSACLEGLALMRKAGPELSGGASGGADASPIQLTPSAALGDFRIQREIGRGGMGVVYEAEQLSVGRNVALKVLPYAAMLDKRQVARFQNEARAAATLDHPHIVPVYYVGNQRGVYYYAMRLIDGKNLAEVLAELRGAQPENELSKVASRLTGIGSAAAPAKHARGIPNDDTARDVAADTIPEILSDHSSRGKYYFRSIARLGKQAAEALDFAHSHGIIHRDIKPANIMLDEVGEAWIADFGLARIESDAGMTLTGDLIGTLRYMSPEQTLANRIEVDHRSDVYSLGATLYEMLTLQPIFAGEDRESILRKIAFSDPKLPSKINAAIPKDLETIVLKSLRKNAEDRYGSAKEFAEDLNRFLSHEPVQARRTPFVQRVRMWSRRHPAITASAVGFCAIALAAAAIIGLLVAQNERDLRAQEADANNEIARGLKEKIEQQDLALAAAQLADARHYVNQIRLAKGEWLYGDHIIAIETLDKTKPALRSWEYNYLEALFVDSIVAEGVAHTDFITGLDFSPNGNHIATCSRDKTIIVWDQESIEPKLTISGHEAPVNAIVYDGTGKRLVSASADKTIRVWDSQTGQQLLQIDYPIAVNTVDISPNGKLIVSGSDDETAKIWDAKTGELVRDCPNVWGRVTSVRFSADGNYFACGTDAKLVDVWSVAETQGGILAQAIGAGLATGLFGSSEFESRLPGHQAPVTSVAFLNEDEDGLGFPPVFAAGQDSTVRSWSWDIDEQIATLTGHRGSVNAMSIGPDDKRVVTAGQDSTLRVWDVETLFTPSQLLVLRGHVESVSCVGFHPGGKLVASGGDDRKLIVWDITEGREDGTWEIPCKNEASCKLSPSGKMVVVASGDKPQPAGEESSEVTGSGSIQVWNIRTRRELASITEASPILSSIVWSHDSQFIASICQDGLVRSWSAADGELIQTIADGLDAPAALAFHPTGELLIADSRRITSWNTEDSSPVNEYPIRCAALAVSADGNSWASVTAKGVVTYRHFAADAELQTFRVPSGERYAIAFTADGQYLACASDQSREITIWDTASATVLHKLIGHYDGVTAINFSLDGRRLVSGSREKSIKVWDWKSGDFLLSLDGHHSEIRDVVMPVDSSSLISIDQNHTLRIWRGE